MRFSVTPVVMAAALAAAPFAASAEPQRLEAVAGAPLALLAETSVDVECMEAMLAEAHVLMQPAHGEVSVRSGRLRRADTNCPAAPGYVVVYLPDAGYSGLDTVSVQVIREGRSSTLEFEILVAEGEALPPGDI
jgi:hypothetical protein